MEVIFFRNLSMILVLVTESCAVLLSLELVLLFAMITVTEVVM